jgi:hypothetical protein
VLRAYARWKAERGETVVGRTDRGSAAAAKETAARGAAAAGAAEPLAAVSVMQLTRGERAEMMRGEPLGFAGLLHAPTTELGVIHLFGVLAPEHGIVVEYLSAAYPDCRAVRPEPCSRGRWRRIAVEFELRSSDFRRHGHDPALCDLIVCWEHDWAECPVEVLELRRVVRLAGKRGSGVEEAVRASRRAVALARAGVV